MINYFCGKNFVQNQKKSGKTMSVSWFLEKKKEMDGDFPFSASNKCQCKINDECLRWTITELSNNWPF